LVHFYPFTKKNLATLVGSYRGTHIHIGRANNSAGKSALLASTDSLDSQFQLSDVCMKPIHTYALSWLVSIYTDTSSFTIDSLQKYKCLFKTFISLKYTQQHCEFTCEEQDCNIQSPKNFTAWRDSNPRSSVSLEETMTTR
jgi:hypothetical protein